MRTYVAYIRVSTQKQGQHGASLQEQRVSIEAFAKRSGFTIVDWVEERVTAAKRGRSGFGDVLATLKAGRAHGIIIHKIDRGARNLKDWADLAELIDSGIEVHIANEHFDMTSRGGRLSADIQAVVAADYIRNLREEVRKGFYGRLRQGLLPLPAPLGYRDDGKGRPKSIDPITGPLVKTAFTLYATGSYSLDSLTEELHRLGLRQKNGVAINRNVVSRMLNKEFYAGIIHIKANGQRFEGIHPPLVSKQLFDRVKARLSSRARHEGLKYEATYRRAIRCGHCQRVLTPEHQKGHVYYRCHKSQCPGVSVRAEVLASNVDDALRSFSLSSSELVMLEAHIAARDATLATDTADVKKATALQMAQIDDRMRRLTDAYIDRLIDQPSFETRQRELLADKVAARERITSLDANATTLQATLREKFELAKTASLSDEGANGVERLNILKSMSSNLAVRQKSIVVAWHSVFGHIANRSLDTCGAPWRI